MRVLMLGWEFPPFIAGGLGTACYGLTKALDRLGHEVVFILPKPVDQSKSSHIRLLSPEAIRALPPDAPVARAAGSGSGVGAAATGAGSPGLGNTGAFVGADSYTMPEFARATFHALPASFSSPYPEFGAKAAAPVHARAANTGTTAIGPDGLPVLGPDGAPLVWPEGVDPQVIHGASAGVGGAGAGYEGDMVDNAERYARLVVALGRHERFDVVHAHDWMTFPAGQWIARISGKPLVVHVHSTEFDRAGDHPNQRVYDIERRGMHAAMRVIAVSELTKSLCTKRYGIDPAKVGVVYNGIDSDSAAAKGADRIEARDKIVLFLGRITMQKGPEYFVRAAKRVLEKVPNTKFIMAGSGDMYTRSIEEAAALGIGHRFSFTGFLRGKQVDEVFRMADCYVMPSVSEPFGIAPLEAMRNDTPVIISKQSGVSEVLTHALKVDFWDIDDIANKIVAVLRHPPLSQTLREHGSFELRKLTWDGAAAKCVQAYEAATSTMTTTVVGARARQH